MLLPSPYRLIAATLTTAVLATGALAAMNKVGNGGDVVRCEKVDTTELLDFYEDTQTKQTLNEKLRNRADVPGHVEIARKNLEKLVPIHRGLAKQYLERLESLPEDIEFKEDIELTDVKDSAHLFLPKGCKLLQLAIRKVDVTNPEKRFVIRSDLWRKLSNEHRAGLFTHEIIYEHFLKLGEKDSVKARKLNRYLNGTNVDKDSFWKLMRDLKIPIYP